MRLLLLSTTWLLGASCTLISATEQVAREAEFDQDGDGASGINGGEDCDDTDPNIGPGAVEVCDGIDQDCDGVADNGVLIEGFNDEDDDGFGSLSVREGCEGDPFFATESGDCDDDDPLTNPGANEICDELDNDCDGEADNAGGSLWYADSDGDGYGNAAQSSESCDAAGLVADNTDCDDSANGIHPGADELCNDLDDDCDGETDEDDAVDVLDWYSDQDGDGYGGEVFRRGCGPPDEPGFWTLQDGDCDDNDLEEYPGAQELCDGADNDCDGQIDETPPTWFVDDDGDGFGDGSLTQQGCDQPPGFAGNDADCNDDNADINPTGTEICNELDDDCDGDLDDDDASVTGKPTWYRDADSDGYGNATSTVTSCALPLGYTDIDTDCDDNNSSVKPGGTEVCNDVDDDCDGAIDEELPGTVYYVDSDGDGHGDSADVGEERCSDPGANFSTDATDCNDGDASISPSASEDCNGIDDDCTGDETNHPDWQTWYADTDTDTYGDAADTEDDCAQPTGYVDNSGDCDDEDDTINPDTDWFPDVDGDGYGDTDASPVTQCDGSTTGLSNPTQDDTDCDDALNTVFPGGTEQCDDVTDGNCDGSLDNDLDGDDFSDEACGGTDCDDDDDQRYPGNGCTQIDCLAILEAGESTGDGIYTIDPDGPFGSNPPFDVTCDMTRNGGGWTLVFEDDFNSTPDAGWTAKNTTTCDGATILGGYNTFGTLTVDNAISARGVPHDAVWTELTLYRIDSWNYGVDSFTVSVDSTVAWAVEYGYFSTPANTCGAGGANFSDAVVPASLVTLQNDDTIDLRLRGVFDQSVANESWGVDDVNVWVRRYDASGAGYSAADPAGSCAEVLSDDPGATDGIYFIDPASNGNTFPAYCDMSTDGGGWMLVNNKTWAHYISTWAATRTPQCAVTLSGDCSSSAPSALGYTEVMWRFADTDDYRLHWEVTSTGTFDNFLAGTAGNYAETISGFTRYVEGVATGPSSVGWAFYQTAGLSEYHGGTDQWMDAWVLEDYDGNNYTSIEGGDTSLRGTKCIAGYCRQAPIWMMVR